MKFFVWGYAAGVLVTFGILLAFGSRPRVRPKRYSSALVAGDAEQFSE